MHTEAYAFVAAVARERPPGPVLEIGGRVVNGTIRGLFYPDRYLAIDVVSGPGVDVVADGATYVPDESPACVVCCEVLEHTADADAIVSHAREILAPDGILIVTTAGPARAPHSAIDGGPLPDGEFYRNVCPGDLARWLEGFEEIRITVAADESDVYALARRRASS